MQVRIKPFETDINNHSEDRTAIGDLRKNIGSNGRVYQTI